MNDIEQYLNTLHVQFVKAQDDFIRKECIRHIKENKEHTIIYIDEDKLDYIFHLGLNEYMKEQMKKYEKENEL